MRAVLPCLRKRKRLFPFMRRDVSPKIRKGKGVESSTIFNAMSFTHRGGKSSSDHRAVGGACKATAINTQKVLPLFSSIAPPASTARLTLLFLPLHYTFLLRNHHHHYHHHHSSTITPWTLYPVKTQSLFFPSSLLKSHDQSYDQQGSPQRFQVSPLRVRPRRWPHQAQGG